MRLPVEVQQKIADLGAQVLEDDASEVDIGEQGAIWLRDHNPLFLLDIAAEWWRKRTRSWTYSQTRQALHKDGDEYGQLPLPFPELHPHLEVAPGVLKHQSVMTGRDWDMALAIYRNRRDQAEVQFRQLERRYEQVRELLTDDLTTADVLDRLDEAA